MIDEDKLFHFLKNDCKYDGENEMKGMIVSCASGYSIGNKIQMWFSQNFFKREAMIHPGRHLAMLYLLMHKYLYTLEKQYQD